MACLPSHLPHASRRRAFTLIELLVVISIIAVLVGILVPALGRARETARNVKCLTNLKGIGMGLQVYMDTESQGKLLPNVSPLNEGDNTNDPGLLDVLTKYVDATAPVRTNPDDDSSDWIVAEPWRCPADTRSFDPAENFKPNWQIAGTSYEYTLGRILVGAELLFVRDPQVGVSRATEARNNQVAVLIDADNWHSPRWEQNVAQGVNADDPSVWRRNGVFFGDWRADKTEAPTEEFIRDFVADVVKFGGGINP